MECIQIGFKGYMMKDKQALRSPSRHEAIPTGQAQRRPGGGAQGRMIDERHQRKHDQLE
jgi:hypothetical protein